MRSDLIGREILGYEIVSFLGEGGMASVWIGENRHLNKRVAIKVLNPMLATDGQVVERFRIEADIQLKLEHPNLVSVENFSLDQLAMVMEYIEGQSLDRILEMRTCLPYTEAWGLFKQVLDALGYAHDSAVVHRDLKPANIIVRANGEAKVMDFGIARVKNASMKTQTGTSLGSPYYMSPEQVLGRKNIDFRTDIYSLGVTFFEVLTGTVPFKGAGEDNSQSDFLVKQAQVQEAPPDPRAINPMIPVKWASAILKALAKEPEHRFQSCRAFKSALESSLTAIEVDPDRRDIQKGVLGETLVAPDVDTVSTLERNNQHEKSHPEPADKEPTIVPIPAPPLPYKKNKTIRNIVITGSLLIAIVLGLSLYFGLKTDNVNVIYNTPTKGRNVSFGHSTSKPSIKRGNNSFDFLKKEPVTVRKQKEVRVIEIKRAAVHKPSFGVTWVRLSGGQSMTKTEVTVGQYAKCVNARICSSSGVIFGYWEGKRLSEKWSKNCNWRHRPGRSEHPMNCVNWYQARRLCEAVGGRLPSSSEWYREASNHGRRHYPWGNGSPNCRLAVFSMGGHGCGKKSSSPVCSRSSSGKSIGGLCDMAGNVEEWTSTMSGGKRVYRGGSFGSKASRLLTSSSSSKLPSTRTEMLGFRCAK